MNDSKYLSSLVNGCIVMDIKSIFNEDFNIETKQIRYNYKTYQCEFVGLHCIGVYEIGESL